MSSFLLDPFENFAEIESAIHKDKQRNLEKKYAIKTPTRLRTIPLQTSLVVDVRKQSPRSVTRIDAEDYEFDKGDVSHVYTHVPVSRAESAPLKPKVSDDEFLNLLLSV